MSNAFGEQVRAQLAQAQERIRLLESGVQERQALLEHARDLLEEHGAHGDDWPAIAPAIERLLGKLAAARADRDRFAAGVPLICADDRHEAKVRGLEADAARLARELAATNELLATAREEAAQRTVERDHARSSHQLQQLNTGRFHAQLAAVRAAVHIADAEDVTDWQRGYRACAERAVAAIDTTQERQ